MERPLISHDWAAAELRRREFPIDSEPVRPAAQGEDSSHPTTRSRRYRFGDFLEKLLEALANSSVQPAGLGPRGFRGRLR